MKQLTDTQIRNLKLQDRRIDLPDGGVPGLMLRATPGGTKTWSMQYRLGGAGGVTERGHKLKGRKRYRVTIGRYPETSIAKAREIASRYWEMAERGDDPQVPLERDATARRVTIKGLADDFLERYVRTRDLRSADKIENALNTHVVPAWGDRSAGSITRKDAVRLLEKTLPKQKQSDGRYHGGPEAARTVRQVLHKMFQWACMQDRLSANPISGVENPTKKIHRDRVLSMDELRAIWRAAGTLGYPYGPMYQLMLLTACRRGEWANSRRAWLDIDQSLMLIPAEAYKSGSAQIVPLVASALEIIEALPHWNTGDHLLSGTGGERPVSGFTRAKRRLGKAIEVELGRPLDNWRPHDFRRSVATHLRRLGTDRHIVKRILGHADRDVTSIYDRYGMLPERRAALEMWTGELLR